jgi:hypothetical protein
LDELFRSFALDTQLPDFLGHVKHVIVDAGKYNVPLWRRNGHVADIIGIDRLVLLILHFCLLMNLFLAALEHPLFVLFVTAAPLELQGSLHVVKVVRDVIHTGLYTDELDVFDGEGDAVRELACFLGNSKFFCEEINVGMV